MPAQAQHVGGRGAVVARQFQRGLDAQTLDEVGRLAHEVLEGHATHEIGELLDGARQFAPAQPILANAPAAAPDCEADAGPVAIRHADGGDLDVLGGAIFAPQDR